MSSPFAVPRHCCHPPPPSSLSPTPPATPRPSSLTAHLSSPPVPLLTTSHPPHLAPPPPVPTLHHPTLVMSLSSSILATGGGRGGRGGGIEGMNLHALRHSGQAAARERKRKKRISSLTRTVNTYFPFPILYRIECQLKMSVDRRFGRLLWIARI